MNCDLSKWSMYICLFNIEGNIWYARQLWYISYVLIRCGLLKIFSFRVFHAMRVFPIFFLRIAYYARIFYNSFHVLRISRYQCISWQYSLFDIYLLKVKGPYPNYCLIEASAQNGHIRVNQSRYRRYTDEPMKRQYINHNLETVLLCEVKGPYPNYCLIEASARNGNIRVNQSFYRRYTDEPMNRQ